MSNVTTLNYAPDVQGTPVLTRLAPAVVTFCFALWLGGLSALLLFVQTLFKNDRASAVIVAPQLFHAFERYALVCAFLAFWTTVVWALRTRSRHVLLMLIFFGVALSLLLISYGVLTPLVETNRGTPAFWKWHGISNLLYLAQMFMVIMAGLALPGAIRATTLSARRTTPATAPVSAPPVDADRPTL